MEPTLSIPVRDVPSERPAADRFMRRLLRLPEVAPHGSVRDAQSAFSKSIFISATRCLLTYVLIPLLGPVVGLSGSVGPVLGLVLGLASAISITLSTRRFFAADHRFRWAYAAIGGTIFVMLIVFAIRDISALVS